MPPPTGMRFPSCVYTLRIPFTEIRLAGFPFFIESGILNYRTVLKIAAAIWSRSVFGCYSTSSTAQTACPILSVVFNLIFYIFMIFSLCISLFRKKCEALHRSFLKEGEVQDGKKTFLQKSFLTILQYHLRKEKKCRSI